MSLLNLDIDFPFPQRITTKAAEGDKGERVGQGSPLWMTDEAGDESKNGIADPNMSENDGQQFAQNIKEQRIHAKDKEEADEPSRSFSVRFFPDINNVH